MSDPTTTDPIADLRRRLLVWRMALLSHARRVRAGVAEREALADDLAHMAKEAGDLAVNLLAVELAGPAADGPSEMEAIEEDAFSSADTTPLGVIVEPEEP